MELILINDNWRLEVLLVLVKGTRQEVPRKAADSEQKCSKSMVIFFGYGVDQTSVGSALCFGSLPGPWRALPALLPAPRREFPKDSMRPPEAPMSLCLATLNSDHAATWPYPAGAQRCRNLAPPWARVAIKHTFLQPEKGRVSRSKRIPSLDKPRRRLLSTKCMSHNA